MISIPTTTNQAREDLARRTLLLMPCSDTKLPHADLPRRLYLGPLWQTLRTHQGRLPWRNVMVLSGRFGFITAETFIQTYNQRMTAELADQLVAAGINGRNPCGGPCAADLVRPAAHRGALAFARVISAGAGDYARVFAAFIPELQAAGIVAADARIDQVKGGIGTQRGQLGCWLREISSEAVTCAA
jgi:hypothetical protein